MRQVITGQQIVDRLRAFHYRAPRGEPLLITESEVSPLADWILGTYVRVMKGDKLNVEKAIRNGTAQLFGRKIHVCT